MIRNLLLSALILFPLCMIAQPNATIRSFRAEKLYIDGIKKFQQRQFYDAIETFNKVIELNREHPNVYEARGDAYYQLKNYQKALDDYEEAINLNPKDANLWNNAGVAAGDMYLFRAAADYFYEAIQLEPDHSDATDNYAEARRLLAQEGYAYEEPRRPRRWEDDYGREDRDDYYGRDGRDTYDRDDNYGRDGRDDYGRSNIDDFYGNSGRPYGGSSSSSSSSSTRPGKYKPTRTGTGSQSNRPDDYKDSPERTQDRDYLFNKSDIRVGPSTDIQLKIDQIRITKNSTMLSFTVRNLGERSFPIKLASRSSKDAWYLTDRSFDRTYKLKTIKNLEGWNQNRPFNLKAKDKQIFIAEFERIDDDVFYFHLLEGKTAKPGAWNIYDIEIANK